MSNKYTVCAPFQKDIRYIFKNFEEDVVKCVGFDNSIRSLLVHNILANIKLHFTVTSEKFRDSISKMIVEGSLKENQLNKETIRKLSLRTMSIPGHYDFKNIYLNHHFKISTGFFFKFYTFSLFLLNSIKAFNK